MEFYFVTQYDPAATAEYLRPRTSRVWRVDKLWSHNSWWTGPPKGGIDLTHP